MKIGRGILFGLLLAPVSLWAVSFSATLDRDTVAVGDSAQLSLVFQGGSPKEQPQVPNIQDLRVGYGGQSSQFSWVNGESSSTVTYTYTLTPVQPGDFTIPPIEVTVGGETLRSQPITIKAVRNAAVQPDAPGADQQLAMLKLVLPKQQIYLGEVVQAEVDLYLRQNVLGVDQCQFTPFTADGFTFGKTVQGAQRMIQIGSARYSIVPFYLSLTAVKTGSLSIDPLGCSIVLQLPGAGTRQGDPFDPFGIFQHNQEKRVTISTDPAPVQVLPLPDGAPADFSGAVGSYSLKMTAAPTDVTAGDPVTVKVQIDGQGALDSVALPPLSVWQKFKVYPPSSKTQTTDQLGMQGSKEFELVVVPQSSDVHELPPLSFSFFDPEQKTYRTLTQPAIALSVKPGLASSAPLMAAAKAATPPPAQDIVPIKLGLGPMTEEGPALVRSPVFWAVQTLPALAWMALLVRRKRADALANNPRLRRRLAVAAIAASGMEDLKRLAARNDSDNFFATLFRLLQEQLGERLDLPASAITESVIDEQLRPRRAPEPVLGRLHDLFLACNQARYAPVKSSQELEAFIPRLETALREIQNLNP
jgi:hypothetical protein